MRIITGKAKGVRLKTPDGMKTRPTAERVKEALFSAIQGYIPGAAVLDLFGGTGQLGLEALSRGANSCVFVDKEKSACELIRENLIKCRLDAQIVRADYLAYLSACRKSFDIIFLDPPYAEVFLENSLKKISEIDILTNRGIIVTERPFGKELRDCFGKLYCCKEYKYGNTIIAIFRKEEEIANENCDLSGQL